MHRHKISITVALAALGVLGAAAPAQAKHSWGDWHWQRGSNPVTLTVLNSTTDARTPLGGQDWPSALARAATDWSQSSVLDLAVQPQTAVDLAAREACPFQPGAIRVCNVVNPDVTWLGLATVLPDPAADSGHLLAATAQMNDTWFSTPLYDATNAQQVMCQEVGHTFGLDHQDDSGADLNTCMDYATALDNPSPNAHDYQQLDTIYAHLDGSGGGATGGSKGAGKGGGKKAKQSGSSATTSTAWSPVDLGLPAGYHGTGTHGAPHSDVYTMQENGQTIVRYVLWAY